MIMIFSTFLLLLSACSLSMKKIENKGKSVTHSDKEVLFTEKNADELLRDSMMVSYPPGKNFVATGLNDDGIAFGESYDEGNESQNYLASLNLKTNNFTKIKVAEKTSDIVSFIINYVDNDYLIFEEFDQINQNSIYYLWDIRKQGLITLMDSRHVTPVHQTQVTRKDSLFYISYYIDDSQYQLEVFDISDGSHHVIEKNNSGSPVIYRENLNYLVIDNQNLITQVVRYDLKSNRKTSLEETKGDDYYSGLISNGSDLLYLLTDSYGKTSFLDSNKENLFSTSNVENPSYKNSFVTYMGERRGEERVKSQYYLLDMKNKINYLYDGGPILISNKGILWIDFKKPDNEIPKGGIYRPENSIMRYLEWK